MVKIKMEPINVSNTSLSLNGKRGHRKFDAKQAKRHDFGRAHCVVCGEIFTKDHQQVTACSEECKSERKKAYGIKYRKENGAKIKASRRRYYEKHKAELTVKRQKHREENREQERATNNAWRNRNRDKVNAQARKRHKDNPELKRANNRKSYKKHREKRVLEKRKYREENRDEINARNRERYHAKKKEE